jgi:hypothetical protein
MTKENIKYQVTLRQAQDDNKDTIHVQPSFWHNLLSQFKNADMNNFWRTLIAGYAGWKWGGGCLGFVVVFIIVFYLLGYIHC